MIISKSTWVNMIKYKRRVNKRIENLRPYEYFQEKSN